jgi:hypothetical protein
MQRIRFIQNLIFGPEDVELKVLYDPKIVSLVVRGFVQISVCFNGTKSVVFGRVMVIVLTIGPMVRGFKPSRDRWIFNGDENP